MKAILAILLMAILLLAAIVCGVCAAGYIIKHESSQTPNTTKR